MNQWYHYKTDDVDRWFAVVDGRTAWTCEVRGQDLLWHAFHGLLRATRDGWVTVFTGYAVDPFFPVPYQSFNKDSPWMNLSHSPIDVSSLSPLPNEQVALN